MRSTRPSRCWCLALAPWSSSGRRRLTTQPGRCWRCSAHSRGDRGVLAPAVPSGRTRTKLQIEIVVHGIIRTGVLWFTGKSSSPLLNLYLLPITLSALTLGRFTTRPSRRDPRHATGACRRTPGVDVASMGDASRAIGNWRPILLSPISRPLCRPTSPRPCDLRDTGDR